MNNRIKPPLAYIGGKTRARKILAAHMPPNVKEMSSIFCGGLSFELYCENELGIKVNKAYDFNPLIINFYNFIKTPENAEKLVDIIAGELEAGKGYNIETYKGHYYNCKKDLKAIKEGNCLNRGIESITDFYVTHNFSRFGNIPSSYKAYSGYNDREITVKNKLKKLLDFKTNMQFECAHFKDSIPRHNNEFLYLDPPYYKDNINLKNNLYFGHNNFNHALLADLMKEHKSKFLMSYNDCEWVREAYKDFNIKVVEWKYSANHSTKGKSDNSYEVIITNYDF